jgi:hypothetical protein
MAIPAMAVSAMADFVSFVLRRDVGSLLVPCCHDRQRKTKFDRRISNLARAEIKMAKKKIFTRRNTA